MRAARLEASIPPASFIRTITERRRCRSIPLHPYQTATSASPREGRAPSYGAAEPHGVAVLLVVLPDTWGEGSQVGDRGIEADLKGTSAAIDLGQQQAALQAGEDTQCEILGVGIGSKASHFDHLGQSELVRPPLSSPPVEVVPRGAPAS